MSPGRIRTTHIDLDLDDQTEIRAGDFLHTMPHEDGPRTPDSYAPIVDAWPTDSRIWANRWTVKLGPALHGAAAVFALATVEAGFGRVHHTTRYRDGEGPHEWFNRAR